MITESDASVGEERLQKYLFEGYSKLALPVKGALDKLYINFSLAISQIVDVVSRIHCINNTGYASFGTQSSLSPWFLGVICPFIRSHPDRKQHLNVGIEFS